MQHCTHGLPQAAPQQEHVFIHWGGLLQQDRGYGIKSPSPLGLPSHQGHRHWEAVPVPWLGRFPSSHWPSQRFHSGTSQEPSTLRDKIKAW